MFKVIRVWNYFIKICINTSSNIFSSSVYRFNKSFIRSSKKIYSTNFRIIYKYYIIFSTIWSQICFYSIKYKVIIFSITRYNFFCPTKNIFKFNIIFIINRFNLRIISIFFNKINNWFCKISTYLKNTIYYSTTRTNNNISNSRSFRIITFKFTFKRN